MSIVLSGATGMWKWRRLRLILLAIAVAVIAAAACALRPDQDRRAVDRRPHFDALRRGMSRGEVDELLGADHGFIPEGYAAAAGPGFGPRAGCGGATWFGRDMVVQVWFDDGTGRVVDKEFLPVVRLPQPSIVARLQRWVGL